MRITDLKDKLINEGCNVNRFGVMQITDDAYSIVKDNEFWEIFYSEHGKKSPPVFRTKNESEACEYFFRLILEERHFHLICFCKNKKDVKLIENQLRAIDVKSIRNDIPAYTTNDDPRFRIFVEGKDVFKVKEHFNKVILKYD